MQKLSRNIKIVELYKLGLTTGQVRDELRRGGFDVPSGQRVWDVWRKSEHYIPRDASTMFCNFCLKAKELYEIFYLRQGTQRYISYRMCAACVDKHLPKPKKDDKRRLPRKS